MPHAVLRKWLFIDSTHEDFESTMSAVAKRVASNDPRFGVLPRGPKPRRLESTLGVRRLMHRKRRVENVTSLSGERAVALEAFTILRS